jgi:hypothetical protein
MEDTPLPCTRSNWIFSLERIAFWENKSTVINGASALSCTRSNGNIRLESAAFCTLNDGGIDTRVSIQDNKAAIRVYNATNSFARESGKILFFYGSKIKNLTR